jgi:type II secretory pathway pseudopilin PulG
MRRRRGTFWRSGVTYIELLASTLLVAIAAAGAFATWSLSLRAPANKRVTEMSVQLAVREIERIKAQKYAGAPETASNSPVVTYFDLYGNTSASAPSRGFQVKSWVITQDTNNDGSFDSSDLREITVQVWDSAGTKMYEQAQTMLSFGGV